jgi:hypothetical protein
MELPTLTILLGRNRACSGQSVQREEVDQKYNILSQIDPAEILLSLLIFGPFRNKIG